jgi:hypothetical protein
MCCVGYAAPAVRRCATDELYHELRHRDTEPNSLLPSRHSHSFMLANL